MLKQMTLFPYIAMSYQEELDRNLEPLIPDILEILSCNPRKSRYCFIEYCKGKKPNELEYPCKYFLTSVPDFLDFISDYTETGLAFSQRVDLIKIGIRKRHVFEQINKELDTRGRRASNHLSQILYSGIFSYFMPVEFRDSVIKSIAEKFEQAVYDVINSKSYRKANASSKLASVYARHSVRLSDLEQIFVDRTLKESMIDRVELINTNIEKFNEVMFDIENADPRYGLVQELARRYVDMSSRPLIAKEEKRIIEKKSRMMEMKLVSSFPLTSFFIYENPARMKMDSIRRSGNIRENIDSLKKRESEFAGDIKFVGELMGLQDVMLKLGNSDYNGMVRFAEEFRDDLETDQNNLRKYGIANTKWRFERQGLIDWVKKADPEAVSKDLQRAWRLYTKRRKLERRLSYIEKELNDGILSSVRKLVPIDELDVMTQEKKAELGPLDNYLFKTEEVLIQ